MSHSDKAMNYYSSPSIGVIGGGQLAQMLVEAAIKRKIHISVQAESVDDPASSKANNLVLANPMDAEGTRNLARTCKHVTFENEWIDVEALKPLENSGIVFSPSLDSIKPLLDKISQRKLLQDLAIPGPKWIPLSSVTDHPINLPSGWKFPVMAKASRGGYDGKGTQVINSACELEKLLRSVPQNQWFLESWVPYEKELAFVASRDSFGSIRTFPFIETYQKGQVCDWVIAPADVEHSVEVFAYNIASTLLTHLNYVGVIAIEFFYGKDGLQVNEIAPRTHNSAHFSIEACTSSQFDQQLCISSGFSSPIPELIEPGALMINLLGLSKDFSTPLDKRLSLLRSIHGLNVHWYGKLKESPGRKLGHVTYLLKSPNSEDRRKEADNLVKTVREIWPTTS